MVLTQKESMYLEELKSQEELCIKKYNESAEKACDEQLKQLLQRIASAEQNHLDTINEMLKGSVPPVPAASPKEKPSFTMSGCSASAKECDKTICQDLLGTEKYVSTVYNTSVFEFRDENARKMLNHIQSEEQDHGKELYDYMSANGMYA